MSFFISLDVFHEENEKTLVKRCMCDLMQYEFYFYLCVNIQEKGMSEQTISIKGARVNNLKNINLEIPRNQLIVITGLSGSGKIVVGL